jgi:hypothetical protein
MMACMARAVGSISALRHLTVVIVGRSRYRFATYRFCSALVFVEDLRMQVISPWIRGYSGSDSAAVKESFSVAGVQPRLMLCSLRHPTIFLGFEPHGCIWTCPSDVDTPEKAGESWRELGRAPRSSRSWMLPNRCSGWSVEKVAYPRGEFELTTNG